MSQVVTNAGEALFAQKAQANKQLDIDTFIFAYVPGQDSQAPVERSEGLPPTAQQVHTQTVQQVGRINNNTVVYSTVLNSLTGPFEFNWVGLYSSVNNTLVAISHVKSVNKTITELGNAGNTLNRNFAIEYSGISDITGITVTPETWQLDFSARLAGMDALTQNLAMDMNGRDWFIGDGFKVEPTANDDEFRVIAGVGYVHGMRVELESDYVFSVQSYPQNVYVDAWFESDTSSSWTVKKQIIVDKNELEDYQSEAGIKHYIFKLAKISGVNSIVDFRLLFGLKNEIKEHIAKDFKAHKASSIDWSEYGKTASDISSANNRVNITDSKYGAIPQPHYSDEIIDCAGAFTSARGELGINGIIWFPKIKGLSETHYYLSTKNLSNCILGADEGVIIHVDAVLDIPTSLPSLITKIIFDQETPISNTNYRFLMEKNKMSPYHGIASAMTVALEKSKSITRRLSLKNDFEPISINEFNPLSFSESFTGMDIIDDEIGWSDHSAAGGNFQGVYRKGVAAGEQYEFLIDMIEEKGGTTGKFRAIIAGSVVGSHWEFSVGSGFIRWYKSGTSVAKNIELQNNVNGLIPVYGCVRFAIKIVESKKVQLIVNDAIIDEQDLVSAVRWIGIAADENGRNIGKIKYANQIQNTVIASGKPLRVLCIGDSTTRGSRSSTPWPLLIEEMAQHMPGIGSLNVENIAISGTTSDFWKSEIDNVDTSNYDYVLLMLGVNDNQSGGAGRVSSFYNNIEYITNKIHLDGSKPIWGVIPKYTNKTSSGNGNDASNNGTLSRYMSAIKSLCLKKGIEFAECCDFLGENYGYKDSFINKLSGSWLVDNIHPNTRGHIAIAAAFSSALVKSEKAQPHYSCRTMPIKTLNGWEPNEVGVRGYPRAMVKDGVLYCSGAVSFGSEDSILCVLDEGFRVSTNKYVLVMNKEGANKQFIDLELRVNGEIVIGSGVLSEYVDLNFSIALY